jgi:NitT/TauT family transport system permease protein
MAVAGQIPTGGDAIQSLSPRAATMADLVRSQSRRYSPDERRQPNRHAYASMSVEFRAIEALKVYSLRGFCCSGGPNMGEKTMQRQAPSGRKRNEVTFIDGEGDSIRVSSAYLQRQRKDRMVQALLVVGGIILLLALWQAVVWLGQYPSYILPSPARVFDRFMRLMLTERLWMHVGVTLSEIFAGLALGLIVAFLMGYGIAKSRALERVLSPYIIASQAIPIVALAPLLVIWFGFGRFSKVLVCALVVFFPILVNTVVGLRSVEREWRDLMRSLEASRWQMFTKLELPAALPVLFGGLKVGVTLSVIGAVVGEFVGADRGLGFLVNLGQGLLDTPLMFVAILLLVAIALGLYGLVSILEGWLLNWRSGS